MNLRQAKQTFRFLAQYEPNNELIPEVLNMLDMEDATSTKSYTVRGLLEDALDACTESLNEQLHDALLLDEMSEPDKQNKP